jgi:uncharacterized protein (TIGR00251 family)
MRLRTQGTAVLLDVKVVPNASRTRIAGVLGDALKVQVAQPPEDGRANRAVEQLLADALGLPAAAVSVVAGHTRPRKTVRLAGLAEADARARLAAHLPPA